MNVFSLVLVLCVYRGVLDVIQPVAPLADDVRSSAMLQGGGVSRANIIDDSERLVK